MSASKIERLLTEAAGALELASLNMREVGRLVALPRDHEFTQRSADLASTVFACKQGVQDLRRDLAVEPK